MSRDGATWGTLARGSGDGDPAGQAGDYMLATGKCYSVYELFETALACIGRDPKWDGLKPTRPASIPLRREVTILVRDASKARSVLGWESKIGFGDLIREMVDSEFRTVRHPGTNGQSR